MHRYMQATRDGSPGKKDAAYIMVYMPVGRSITINTSYIPSKRRRAWWYDPRYGAAIPLVESENTCTLEGDWNTLPWHRGAGPDWVFMVDDASMNYPTSGERLK